MATRLLEQEGLRGLMAALLALYKPGNTVAISINSLEIHSRNQPIPPHAKHVDIVICVHNALADVERCLTSVLSHTNAPFSIILVDDGSNQETGGHLQSLAARPDIVIVRNETARGYTLAANQGLRVANSRYVVLLNSDTLVSEGWLDRMVACAQSSQTIGIVGPLSNTASWQSVPFLEECADWAANDLSEGVSVEAMAEQIASWSGRLYPRLPFLNGFCLMIKRELIEQIGYFDERTFGAGFGEENDYCLRARQAGWELAVADDVYIYHAQSRSYSNDRRLKLASLASEALNKKHGMRIVVEGVQQCREDRVMLGIRARAALMHQRQEYIVKGCRNWEGRKITFILPVGSAGGGANIVLSEALAMRQMGVDAQVINLAALRDSFEKAYPNLEIPVTYIPTGMLLHDYCSDPEAAVVATTFFSVSWFRNLREKAPARTLGYYIQDFEPDFFEPSSELYAEAVASYTLIPGIVRLTKTAWNRDMIRDRVGCDSRVLGPSCDVDLFRPRGSWGLTWRTRPLRIAAMVRPETPRRNPQLTLDILQKIVRKYHDNVEVMIFGAETAHPALSDVSAVPQIKLLGVQNAAQLATLFNSVDIFADFSSFQAMGLTAMEAMSSGVAVIVPRRGGALTFATDRVNALVVDTASENACLDALSLLIEDNTLRLELQAQAIQDVASYYPEHAASLMLEALFRPSERMQ